MTFQYAHHRGDEAIAGKLVVAGVALRAFDPNLAARLTHLAPGGRWIAQAFVLDGEGFQRRLRGLLERLTRTERDLLVGAVIPEGGDFDAWEAVPASQLMVCLETPWFPRLLIDRTFEFHFQPIVRTTDFGVVGHEVLVRARVAGEFISGGRIIDAARAHRGLARLDLLCQRMAVEHGGPRLQGEERLFVNFLPLSMHEPGTGPAALLDAAERAGVDPARIVLEVVESEAFPDLSHLRAMLEAYRMNGMGVALDDLGTGQTALRYIDELAPDCIKLAKDLIPHYPRESDLAIVRGLLRHAKGRGITVLAEGVETARQVAVARELGIDLLQGYLLGRPAPEMVHEITVQRRKPA